MKPAVTKSLLFVLMIALPCSAQNRRRVILDQDGRGPATTDQQSMILMLQSPLVETLGITIVSGDQWRDEEVAHTLRMLELTGHKDVKVYPGAIFPLINSKEEIRRWQKRYGVVRYQGAWNEKGFGLCRVRPPPQHGTREFTGVRSKCRICPREIPR